MPGLTPSQVSEMLGIPPATLRRYTKLFAPHLSPDSQRQRGRRYSRADIHMLGRARELFGGGLQTDEVQERLPESGDEAVPVGSPTPSVVSGGDVPSVAPHGAAAPPEGTDGPRHQLEELIRTQEALAAATSNLARWQMISEDRQSRSDERLSIAEYKLARIEEWLKLPWLKRLFSRPPFWG